MIRPCCYGPHPRCVSALYAPGFKMLAIREEFAGRAVPLRDPYA
ncbi:hypothetical protein [Microtetraspora malaysiensis]|uniref:Uncharacterized protein n=1 Tax=Microtetraspora malaysiensis TaxID=161358 RepID=A0ABW6SNY0_9ACTN